MSFSAYFWVKICYDSYWGRLIHSPLTSTRRRSLVQLQYRPKSVSLEQFRTYEKDGVKILIPVETKKGSVAVKGSNKRPVDHGGPI